MSTTNRTKTWIHAAIIIAFMTLFGMLPPVGPLTQMGMQVLGIFIGLVWGWSIGETIWPSLLGLVMLGFTEGNTVAGIYNQAFGNATLQQTLYSLLFCYAVGRCGLLEYTAKFILSQKFAQKGPWWLCLAFWIAASVAAAVTTNALPVVVLLWSIFYPIAKELELPKKSPYVAVMLIGICVTAYLGGIIVPYNPFTAICLGVVRGADPTLTMNYAAYCILMLILNVILIPLLVVFFKFVVRVPVEYKVVGNLIDPKDLIMTFQQKIVGCYVILLCVLMIVPNFLPKDLWIATVLNNLGVNGIFIVIMVAMTLTITATGDNLMDFAEGMVRGVPWGLYFLLLAALTISSYIASSSTGIMDGIILLLNPLLSGRSAFWIMVIMVILGCIVTNCINNVVTITLLVPISMVFLNQVNGDPMVLAALFSLVLLQGVVMPSGSTLGALLHGNDEWLTPGLIYKYAIMAEVVLALVVGFIGVPVGTFLFGIF